MTDRPRSFAEFSASPNYRGRYRNAATGYVVGNVLESCAPHDDRSHALRGNAARDAPRPSQAKRGASVEAFPRGAWERSNREQGKLAQGSDWIEQFVIRHPIAAADHPIAPRGLGFIQRLIRIVKPQGCVGMRRVKCGQTDTQTDFQPRTLLVT